MSYKGRARETAYAKAERKFFKQNPGMTKVIIPPSEYFPQADAVLAKIVGPGQQADEIVARIEMDPLRPNRDKFSKGDMVLAKRREPKEWPWIVEKL